MERCANTEALNRYEREMDKNERDAEIAIESFRAMMFDAITHLGVEFNRIAKYSIINRNELRNILMEDVGEML